MTHPNNPELLNTVLQLLTAQGASGLAEGFRLLLNEAMRQERSAVLQASPTSTARSGSGTPTASSPKPLPPESARSS